MQVKIQVIVKDLRADIMDIKEDLACYCERFGDISVVDVIPMEEKQESLWRT